MAWYAGSNSINNGSLGWFFEPAPAVGVTGTLVATEAQDSADLSGFIAHVGTLTATEAQDVFAAAGTVVGAPSTITGSLAVTEAQDTFGAAGKVAHVGTLSATEAQDAISAAGKLAHVGTLAVTEGQDSFASVGAIAGQISGFLAATEAQDEATFVGQVQSNGEVIGLGFEMGAKTVRQAKTVREVRFKPLLQRILEARAERIKPVKKAARAKARSIEGIAAELAMNDGGEKQFRALMDEWLAQKPQLPEAPDLDVEQLFMAQVAMRVQRILAAKEARRLFDQDEEDALIALLA